MNVTKAPFSCQRGAYTIRGFCYRPKIGSGRTPVILSHGFLANQRSVRSYAVALAKAGYAAFTYDFCGGGLYSKSDGSFRTMSLDTEQEDLLAVIAYVCAQDGLDPERLILFGASQGGFVSCLVAAAHPELAHRLILLYPALCIPDDARHGQMLTMKFDPQHIEETFTSRPFRFSPDYPRSAIGLQVEEILPNIPCPMLILHGDCDEIVNVRYAKAAALLAAHPASSLVILKGAGHGFNRRQNREAIVHMLRYLRNTRT